MADQQVPQIGKFNDPLLNASFENPEKKKDKEYGRTLLSRIYRQQNNQSTSFYFGGRNLRWQENWKWAMGRQDMAEFADLVSIDGNKALSPVDMTPNRTAPQFVETLINSMAQNELYPCVTAIDKGSLSEKEERKLDALFRMKKAAEIDAMQQAAGMQLEPSGVYVPDDELSAEVYFKLEDRLPKEIEFEQLVEKCMYDNQFNQQRRATLRDLIVLNCAATKIEKDENGYKHIRKCIPANMIYNFFLSDSGKMELSYIGETYLLKIRDLRRKWGKSPSNPNGLTEEEIFGLAKSSTQLNNANRFSFYWNQNYNYSIDRPYDDYGVQVFDCEIKVFDADYYTEKQDAYGKANIQAKKGIPNPTSETTKVIKKDKFTVYRGVWCISADKMIYWGLPDVIIKPFMDISESLFSYSIQIPNNDGDYVPSLFERALEPLREYTLCKLKRKQLVANLRASGIAIDIETIRDIDLGAGKSIAPMEVVKIYNQTGNVIWSSRGLDPNEQQRMPITEMPNAGSIAQLNELTNIMNSCMQEIRSLLGVPLYRDGSDVGDRTAAKLAEGQQASSFNVTDFVALSDKWLWEETLHKICIMEWDDVVLKKGKTQLMDTVFETKLELKATEYEKQMLEQNIQIAMRQLDGSGKPLISFKDAFKIRNIKNYKLAEMYLSNMVAENEKKHIAESERLQAQNGQIQQESAQAAAAAQKQIQADKIQSEETIQEFISRNKKEEIALEKILSIFDTITKTGGQFPQELQGFAKTIIDNVLIPTQSENKDLVQEVIDKEHDKMAHQYAQQQMMQSQQETPQGEQAEPMQETMPQEQQELQPQ